MAASGTAAVVATEATAATAAAGATVSGAAAGALSASALAAASAGTTAGITGGLVGGSSLFAGLGGWGAVASTGLSLVSGLMNYQQGQYQSGVDQIAAQQKLTDANMKDQSTDLQLQQVIGRQKAIYGASGVDVTEGSPLDSSKSAATLAGVTKYQTDYDAQAQATALGSAATVAQQQGIASGFQPIASYLTGPSSPIANYAAYVKTNSGSNSNTVN